jgi:quinol monooxygenase YgiN
MMMTVLVTHRVADYNTWRPEFDSAVRADWAKDIRSYHVWRGADDPNLVIVANTFDSREAAEALMNNPTLREAMGRGGVVASSVHVDYLNEVGSSTR